MDTWRIKPKIRKDVIFTVRYYLGTSKIQSRIVELPDKGEFTKAFHITMMAVSPKHFVCLVLYLGYLRSY